MGNTNTITFKYTYPEDATDTEKYQIDCLIISAVNKDFWKMYRDNLITNFNLIDEDMEGDNKND